MSEIDLDIAKIVAERLKALMQHYDLTVYGVEAGSKVEVHTITKILNLQTNMAFRTAKRLAAFFDIPPDSFFSKRVIRVKSIEKNPGMKAFYEDNPLNNKYFASRKNDTVFAHFLRTVLLEDPAFFQPMQVKEIAAYVKRTYHKTFHSKTVAKELSRTYEKGLLKRIDKTGTGSVYQYARKDTKEK